MTSLGFCMYSTWVQLNFNTGVQLLVLPGFLFSTDVNMLVPPQLFGVLLFRKGMYWPYEF